MDNRGITCVEFVVIMAMIGILFAILQPGFSHRNSEAARRASCANNLKQIGLSLKMYSNESVGGAYPRTGFYYEPLVDCDSADYVESGGDVAVYTNSFRLRDVYPEYMPDALVLNCPSDVDIGWDVPYRSKTSETEFSQLCGQDGRGATQAGLSYTYLNYIFDEVGVDARRARVSDIGVLGELWGDEELTDEIPVQLGLYASILFDLKSRDPGRLLEVLDGDIDLVELSESFDVSALVPDGNIGIKSTNKLFRIREGVERFLLTDNSTLAETRRVKSEIPVMFDNPGMLPTKSNHIPGGSNVLYLDGHVSFVRWNEGFSSSSEFGALMEAMERHPTFMKK